jgi:urease accessory protein
MFIKFFIILFVSATCGPALAHTGGGGVLGGFVAGYSHPLFGIDHMLAMLAVGMWGAQLGGRAVWVLPVAFPMLMALGGAAAILGMTLSHVELGIAGSVVVLGLAVALAAKPPVWIGAVIVGALALFHGHAHGTELPGALDPLAYGIGFVAATGTIHAAGIGIGAVSLLPRGALALRAFGGAVCAAGVFLLARPLLT